MKLGDKRSWAVAVVWCLGGGAGNRLNCN